MYIEYYANDGSLRCLGDVNELYHYNHNHDALGRFAGSSGARSYQRQIKKHTKKYAKEYAKEMRSAYKARKAFNKTTKYSNKLEKKHRDSKKVTGKDEYSLNVTPREYKKLLKLSDTYGKSNTRSNGYKWAKQNEQKQINELVKSAQKEGYEVTSRKSTRSAQRGRDFVNYLMGGESYGGVAALAKNKRQYQKYGQYYNGETPSRINVDYYKVRNKRKK